MCIWLSYSECVICYEFSANDVQRDVSNLLRPGGWPFRSGWSPAGEQYQGVAAVARALDASMVQC